MNLRKFFAFGGFALFLITYCLRAPGALAADDGPATRSEGMTYVEDWRTSGPQGGDVRSLVVDPKNPAHFYFGTLDGQIYASYDSARSWRLLYNFNIPRLFVDHIIIDPRDSNTLYMGAHRHKEAGGFFKSTDGGRKWRESKELKNEAIHSLAQSEFNPNVLLAGTFNGIYRSDDSGASWAQLPTYSTPGLVHVESLALDPTTADIIYAGTWYLPYKSTDGGKSWYSIKNGIIDDSDIFAIDIDPRDRNHIIASACSGIYETRNAGANWKKVQGIPSQSRRTRAILQHPSIPGLVFAGTTEGFWRSERGGNADSWMVTTSRQLEINSIAVHPANPQTIYIGTNNYGVMVSSDGGKSFEPSNGGYSGRFANAILPDRDMPNRVYATTINTTTGGGFFFVSDDGGQSWRPSMRSMPSRLIGYSILQDIVDPNIIYLGTNLGVYRSPDRGASWAPVWSGGKGSDEKPVAKPAPVRGKKPARRTAVKRPVPSKAVSETVRRAQVALNAAGYPVGVPDGRAGSQTLAAITRFQTDKSLPVTGNLDQVTLAALGLGVGESTASASGLGAQILTDAVNDLIQITDPETQRPFMLAATNAGVFKSYDPAKGWRKLEYGPGFDVHTSSVSALNKLPDTIWVGTASSGVLVTSDGGKSWRQVDGIPTDVPVNVITQDPSRPNNVYVGTKQAFFATRDGGQHWQRRGGNLPFGDFTSILVNARNGDELFVGNAYQNGENGGGVYHSTNAGLTWSRIDPRERRLPSFRIWSLALDNQNQGTLFVGSHSAGIYVVARGGERASTSRR
ncbi:MAG TPA: YCF48-related protein [Pyrinomonadaceae bacterium]|nr:YCF48-related protein [Pyrinomonadaceae bacterium]